MEEGVLLDIRNLKQFFQIQRGFLKRTVGYVKAVNDVNLEIKENETLGLVGESGCGKTTLGRSILRLYEPTEGEIYFRVNNEVIPILELDNKEMRKIRSQMQVIFQDPYSSLNERMTVLGNVGEPLLNNNIAKGRELEERVANILTEVGLQEEHLRRYPHSFSGGQRQRIVIARALVVNPKFIVADESVSALDVSIQAQILNLLKDIQEEFGLTYLFISHDLSVVRYVCDRIAVMYVGSIVE
ncbi:MAG: ATP-binding cassette domain-containing protein, partial [Bacillota bacterium]